jgi:uncharacterized protein (DUF2235 family)
MKKRIIICCDGTWNTPTQTADGIICPTNVAHLARAILPEDANGTPQLTLYLEGVGAEDSLRQFIRDTRGIRRKILRGLQFFLYGPAHLAGGAFGLGLSKAIEEGYRFLSLNYQQGDDLFFFGFSRGAYAVRSLTGLIRNSGILRKQHLDQFDAAYQLYQDRNLASHPRAITATEFRRQFSYETTLKFIGVWDTVGSLGIPDYIANRLIGDLWKFHDTSLSTKVERAYQALALDERRGDFQPCLWKKQPDAPAKQILEQVWFSGVHCDVGGGYAEHGLADCALEWMMNRAAAQGCSLAFDPAFLQQEVQPDPLGEMHDSLHGFFARRPTYIRPVGKESPETEKICSSVQQRQEHARLGYQPENLKHYAGPYVSIYQEQAQSGTTGPSRQ